MERHTIKDAAAALGISRQALDAKMRRLGVKASVVGTSRVRVISSAQLRALAKTMVERKK
jgi:enoyl-[acyl-carrier-protein] reductase (NADH)